MAAAAAFAALAGAAGAQVPDPFARALAQDLTRADQAVAVEGYARAAGPFSGGLGEGRTQRFTVTLRAGQAYRLVGVCDGRCGQLYLAVFNPEGHRIGADRPGRAPVLDLRSESTGSYTIEATMVSCTASTCWYAFNVYAR